MAVACAEAGTYAGTGCIVMGAVSGPATTWGDDIGSSVLFFMLGQAGFIVFSIVINLPFITSYNLYDEIKRKNVAAGLLYALEVTAVGYLLANATVKVRRVTQPSLARHPPTHPPTCLLAQSDALLAYLTWFLLGGTVLILTRYLIDWVIIPGQRLNDEIHTDRNVGAALLVGGLHLGIVHVMNTFLPDSCSNNT